MRRRAFGFGILIVLHGCGGATFPVKYDSKYADVLDFSRVITDGQVYDRGGYVEFNGARSQRATGLYSYANYCAGIGGNYQSSTLYIYNRLRRMTRGKCWVRDGIVFVSAVATRGYEEAPPSTIEIAAYVPKRGAFEEGQMWELTEDLVARIKRFAGWSNYYAEKNFKREILKRRYPGYDVIILD